MIPSQNIGVTKTALTVIYEKSRTPSDLLPRVFVHVNHKAFDMGKLKIFEDLAIAVFNMAPKLAADNVVPSISKKLKAYSTHGIR